MCVLKVYGKCNMKMIICVCKNIDKEKCVMYVHMGVKAEYLFWEKGRTKVIGSKIRNV